MQINTERLWQHIDELGKIGKNKDGSTTRLPFTKVDQQAQLKIMEWMKEASLDVEVDAVGNVIGTYTGSDVTLLPLLCGSHYDTVKNGGNFDGCYGLLAAIEVMQSMYEKGVKVKRSIKVIAFKDEEGNRFGQGMVGSKAIAQTFQEAYFSSTDEDGITLFEAMQKANHHPEKYLSCKIDAHSMYELHIEQAKVLEETAAKIGIVEAIAGIVRYTITCVGKSAHAGATPMEHRQDPVVAMSEWIVKMNAWVKKQSNLRFTIGKIDTYPGAYNVICEQVTWSVDIRYMDEELKKELQSKMKEECNVLEQTYQVQMQMHIQQESSPCLCDSQTQKQLISICENKNYTYVSLMSGAGHDCMNFKEVCPVTLIFVPSLHGDSHCKEEYTSIEECAIGADLLYEILYTKAIE